ncbi:MAG: PEP-CTERM sorting domain-containing protein [Sphingomonadales bacterium]|nr:MAG: PEP-CTERM sorting domain-containing protein [Sphingomonadales bacterium]
MLKFTTALAFAGAALAAAPAHAALFTIDDFAVIQSVTDVADGVATTSGAPIAVAGGLRTISVNTVGSDLPGQLTTVTSNGDFLDVANSSRVSAAIDITYTLGAVGGFEDFTVGTLSLIFEANNPANAVDTTFAIDFVGGGNFSIGPVVVPAIDTPTPFDIPLTKAQLDALTGGGALSLKVNGGNGYDFGLKIVGIQAPEPGSILLLGAGLLGLGLASRRKRA